MIALQLIGAAVCIAVLVVSTLVIAGGTRGEDGWDDVNK